jgi:hypothetical protein
LTSSKAVGLRDWGLDERASARSSASESVSTSESESVSESEAGAGRDFLIFLVDDDDSGLSVRSTIDGSLGVDDDFDFWEEEEGK